LRVIISGGGTGGHIYPAIAIAQGLKERCGADILYVGGENSPESRLATLNGLAFKGAPCYPLKGGPSEIIKSAALNYRGFRRSRQIIKDFGADLIIGTGGYASAPLLYAGAILKTPILIHEQNAYPGKVNRLLSKRANRVCLSFEAAAKYFPAGSKLVFTGLPVRKSIIEARREEALSQLGLNKERPVFLLTGGSQGAKRINEAIVPAARKLLDEGIQIIHICGKNNYREIKEEYKNNGTLDREGLFLLSYSNNMENILAAADLALARAGASFVAEVLVRGLPAVLVPYPYAAGNHQEKNALAVAEKEAAIIIHDKDLNPQSLCETALPLLRDKAALKKMSAGALSLSRPYALDSIVDEALSLVSRDI
jgi:UDP-N-acetylglucosamine--N-acetylmuramyl-(pentapeptide) pyrophosphoryl-undecaprenol N-acetylglucosamine transferase